MKPNDPAFPVVFKDSPISSYTGLTIRQYYASMIMQGMVTQHLPAVEDKYTFIRAAFAIADAMIEFEEKEND